MNCKINLTLSCLHLIVSSILSFFVLILCMIQLIRQNNNDDATKYLDLILVVLAIWCKPPKIPKLKTNPIDSTTPQLYPHQPQEFVQSP